MTINNNRARRHLCVLERCWCLIILFRNENCASQMQKLDQIRTKEARAQHSPCSTENWAPARGQRQHAATNSSATVVLRANCSCWLILVLPVCCVWFVLARGRKLLLVGGGACVLMQTCVGWPASGLLVCARWAGSSVVIMRASAWPGQGEPGRQRSREPASVLTACFVGVWIGMEPNEKCARARSRPPPTGRALSARGVRPVCARACAGQRAAAD